MFSIKDGNGKIVLVTIGADMNGLEDDARIDWEIVANSETGSVYSIDQGSVGTFIPGEGNYAVKADRKKWTYRRGMENSVWPVLEEIANTIPNAKLMVIDDCGHMSPMESPQIVTDLIRFWLCH